MYKLKEIIDLMEAIKDKDNSNEMTRKQKAILKKSYDLYIEAKGIDDVSSNFLRKKVDTYSLVFDYILNERFNIDRLDTSVRKDIQLFKALLDNKNKTITLKDLYKAVYKGIYTESEIESRFSDYGTRKAFLSELNGSILEEKVADIKLESFDGTNFENIEIEVGDKDNPLLFVSSLNASKTPKLAVKNSDDVTIITFSDLHLDAGCYEVDLETGLVVLNQEKLNNNLLSFIDFRDKIMADLAKQNVKVGGVVFTGDVFDAFTVKGHDIEKPVSFVRENRKDLMNGIIEFQKEYGDVLKTPNSNDKPTFVAYIAGNHDMTLGKKNFDNLMKAFGNDVVGLGSGSARLMIGKDFLSFMHHDALDWGLAGWDLKYTTRKARNKNTFRFDDYFEICKKYYDSLGEDKGNCTINDLIKMVSKEMKEKNPELYRYYLPYTIANSTKNLGEIGTGENRINPAIPFFANFMYISPVEPYELCKKEKVFPEPMKFSQFVSLGRRVQSVLDSENLTIPQFGREDNYRPALTILGHFHTKLKGHDGNVHRVSHGSSTGSDKHFPVAISEGASYYEGKRGKNNYELSATQYNLKIKNGRISRIGVIPIIASLKKVKTNGVIEFQGDIEKMNETTYSSSRRH